MRLNQAIASTGFCSRRKADQFIASGKVKVNGELVTDFGRQVDLAQDKLEVNGKKLSAADHIYVMLNKPAGFITSMNDELGRRTVLDLLPPELRSLRPVGRLDFNSEGLLILTNDGALAQKLTHPGKNLHKIYEVKVNGQMSDAELARLAKGIRLEDGLTLPAKTRLKNRNKSHTEFLISIREGRNRQIRRMCLALGYKVVRLRRLGIGRLQLGQIDSGSWRYLTDVEVKLLYKQQAD